LRLQVAAKMIPKIIHCIWLGGPKTALAEKCLASWRCFAPDWEIKEWNEIPSDAPEYVKKALAAKKWAFAADWLRFVVLEREGGVYFDFDVELVRPLTDALSEMNLADSEWCAMEWLKTGRQGFAPGAGLALEPRSEAARRMLSIYEDEKFDGNTTVGDLMFSNDVRPKGVPPEIFCPFDHFHRSLRTRQTIGVHHYALSWITPQRRVARWLNWHGFGWVTEALLKCKRLS